MTLNEMLRASADRFPDRAAIKQDSRTLTYAEFLYRAENLAAALVKSGLKKGDMVGVMLPKSIETIISFLGISMAGCVYVPLDPGPPRINLRYVLNLTHPGALIVDAALYPALSGIELPCKTFVVVGEKPDLGCLGWEEVTTGGMAALRGNGNLPAMLDDDVVYLNFTSGTTGVPKGAITTHANIYYNTLASVEDLGLVPDDVHLCMFPVFLHPHELFARSLYLGGTAVLYDGISPKGVARVVSEHKVTAMMAVAAIYEACTRQHETSPLDFSALRVPESGGNNVPANLVHKFDRQFGNPIFPVWGSTETTGIAIATPLDRALYRPDTMGKPCSHYDVRLVDDKGEPVPPGIIGEMLVGGPAVCSGYYKNTAESNKHLQGGWFATGDMVMKDSDGYYYFVDRKSRMMKVAGMKVFPSEIEKVIRRHPKVREVVVAKMEDKTHGEAPKAYIVLEDGGTIDKNEIRKHCEESIAAYKIPRAVKVVDALPKTPSGKIIYRDLELLG